jgi:hypothetical protein
MSISGISAYQSQNIFALGGAQVSTARTPAQQSKVAAARGDTVSFSQEALARMEAMKAGNAGAVLQSASASASSGDDMLTLADLRPDLFPPDAGGEVFARAFSKYLAHARGEITFQGEDCWKSDLPELYQENNPVLAELKRMREELEKLKAELESRNCSEASEELIRLIEAQIREIDGQIEHEKSLERLRNKLQSLAARKGEIAADKSLSKEEKAAQTQLVEAEVAGVLGQIGDMGGVGMGLDNSEALSQSIGKEPSSFEASLQRIDIDPFDSDEVQEQRRESA